MKKIILTLLSSTLLMLAFVNASLAKTLYKEKGFIEVTQSEVIDDDLFAAGETVNVDGKVNGDAFVGGGSVRVTGDIVGNLHIGGGSVTVSGGVSGNLYIGGGTVNLTGANIGGSVIVGAGSVYIDSESKIGRSLIAGAGTVDNEAEVKRDVMVGAGTILLNSSVGGDVNLGAGEINLGSKTKIAGNLTYGIQEGDGNFTKSDGAVIVGETKKVENSAMARIDREKLRGKIITGVRGAKIGWTVVLFLGHLILGIVLIRLFPKPSEELSKQVSDSFWKNIGVGFLVCVLIVPVLIVMAITIVGLPLAGLTLAVFMITLSLSKLSVALGLGVFLGEKIGWDKPTLYRSFALGLLAVYLLTNVPVVGFVFSLVFTLSGIGCLSLYYKAKLPAK